MERQMIFFLSVIGTLAGAISAIFTVISVFEGFKQVSFDAAAVPPGSNLATIANADSAYTVAFFFMKLFGIVVGTMDGFSFPKK
jgi:hypothetical protein